MATEIFGCSDDLIEFRGDVDGETGYFAPDDDDKPALVTCSDGTVLTVKYGKPTGGIWAVTLVRAGDLFDRIDACDDEDADPYSDKAHFRDGLKWALVSTTWQKAH